MNENCSSIPRYINFAIKNRLITLPEYLEIPLDERDSMGTLFSARGQYAVKNGYITLEQYLAIPYGERDSMGTLFSFYGIDFLRKGIINLDEYLAIPYNERDSMKEFFSANGLRAVDKGILTLDKFLQIPCDKRDLIDTLFSYEDLSEVADDIMMLNKYFKTNCNDTKIFIMEFLCSEDEDWIIEVGDLYIDFHDFLNFANRQSRVAKDIWILDKVAKYSISRTMGTFQKDAINIAKKYASDKGEDELFCAVFEKNGLLSPIIDYKQKNDKDTSTRTAINKIIWPEPSRLCGCRPY